MSSSQFAAAHGRLWNLESNGASSSAGRSGGADGDSKYEGVFEWVSQEIVRTLDLRLVR